MRTMISRVMLIGGAFMLTVPASADFQLSPVDTGPMFLVVHGDPHEEGGNWEQHFGARTSGVSFDLFAVRLASDGDFFGSP